MTAAKNVGMWHRGLRWERKYSIKTGDARTFASPTCGASARLVDLYSSYVCDFVLFCLVAIASFYFLPTIHHIGESGMGPATIVFIFGQLTPLNLFPCVCIPHYLI